MNDAVMIAGVWVSSTGGRAGNHMFKMETEHIMFRLVRMWETQVL
jgi:hypothetical protein